MIYTIYINCEIWAWKSDVKGRSCNLARPSMTGMSDAPSAQRPEEAEEIVEDKVPIGHAGPPVWSSSCGSARVLEEAKEEQQEDVQGKPARPCCSQKGQAAAQAADAGPRPQKQTSLPGWVWVVFSGAAVGALLLLRHLRQRGRGKSKVQPVHVPRERVFSQLLHLACPPPAPLQPQPLAGRSLVVSDRCASLLTSRAGQADTSGWFAPVWSFEAFSQLAPCISACSA